MRFQHFQRSALQPPTIVKGEKSKERPMVLVSSCRKLRRSAKQRDTYRKAQIDLILGAFVGDPNGEKHLCEVVRDESVSRPLREQANTSCNEGSLSIARSLNQFKPAALGVLNLVLYSKLNLCKLCSNKCAFAISFGMVLDQNLEGFVASIFGYQPAW